MEKINPLQTVAVTPTTIDDGGELLIKQLRNNNTESSVTINKIIKSVKAADKTVAGIDARVTTIEEANSLDDLDDVIISSVSEGDVLTYESAQWKNKSVAAGFNWSSFPVGWINLFYGNLANIPAGWQICNGTNGTPNLLDRVPVGAGSTYSLGTYGGENTHTLSITEIPSHNHSVVKKGNVNYGGDAVAGAEGTVYGNPGTSYAGGGAAHNNMQAFCAVYYIMKVS